MTSRTRRLLTALRRSAFGIPAADYLPNIPAIETIILDEYAEHADPLHGEVVGVLGGCGSGTAVSNAVFNATGIRVCDFPITLAKLLPGLPAPA